MKGKTSFNGKLRIDVYGKVPIRDIAFNWFLNLFRKTKIYYRGKKNAAKNNRKS